MIIDGKAIALNIQSDIKAEANSLREMGIAPTLAVILVGEDEGSKIYVRNKIAACERCDIKSLSFKFDKDITEGELLEVIGGLNDDSNVHGILVQSPLPKHINEQNVLKAVKASKDVDCFNPYNVGSLVIGESGLMPCTPSGVIELIKSTGTPICGKNAVVIGRSNIVGKPTAIMLLKENATVTICHSRTENLKEVTRQADIIVCAIGKANFLTADMVKEGAIVIDVGMNRNELGKVCGDVDFENVSKVASFITPVPGGVGPMTITMLLKNTIRAASVQNIDVLKKQ